MTMALSLFEKSTRSSCATKATPTHLEDEINLLCQRQRMFESDTDNKRDNKRHGGPSGAPTLKPNGMFVLFFSSLPDDDKLKILIGISDMYLLIRT